MTDDEILAKSEEIKARRKRASRAREFMNADRVVLGIIIRGEIYNAIDIPRDANLAALLCRLFDCNITEGADQ
ncbi:hypothetical protein [Roseobacter sp. TSBP12]|uniref:hypothetical protein n=1 Tax=Roseobacter sp. TSBP12 TaxID=1236613 RepID=UPI00125F912C|nr:hypothetical protein [Roseobacter sp. TSBP12]KAB6714303.1 hypothetical protein C8029_21425 [Roseobacter sp. TSBP12]